MFLINNLPINSRMNTTHLNFLPTKVQFGFTLAEVLITLGIIGVVAAMTIPNLMTKNQQRETVTKLERAISVFNQAYKMSWVTLHHMKRWHLGHLNMSKNIGLHL